MDIKQKELVVCVNRATIQNIIDYSTICHSTLALDLLNRFGGSIANVSLKEIDGYLDSWISLYPGMSKSDKNIVLQQAKDFESGIINNENRK